jgi:branched-chain amino acid transport system permease protein
VIILNLQVLQGLSLYLSQLRQSDAVIPIINFAWKNLSTQLDPAKYQRMLFGIILIVMMIYRPAGLIPAERRKRELTREEEALENNDLGAGGADAQDSTGQSTSGEVEHGAA